MSNNSERNGESMSLKTAIIAWNGRVAPVFDLAPDYYLFEDSTDQTGGNLVPRNFKAAGWASKVEELVKEKVQKVVCGALCRRCAQTMEDNGIQVVSGIAGDVAELHQKGLENIESLEEYQMPGMKMQAGARRFGCGGGEGRGIGRGTGRGIGRGSGTARGTGRGTGRGNGQGNGMQNRLRDGSCQNLNRNRGRS